MSGRDGTYGHDANGEDQPRVVVRDKRRIDPVTGQVRVPPAGEEPAGGGVQVDDGGPGSAAVDASAELTALQAQLDERTGDLQRISAEYSNYRRRVERDRQLVHDTAKAQIVTQLLTVLDDIERAAAHGDLSGAFKAVADKVVAALAAQGLQSFGAVGEGFDPEVHEAVQHSTSPEADKPTVTAVLRLGYRVGERVLRPAMVAVTDTESEPAPEGDADLPDEAPRGDEARGDEAQNDEAHTGEAGQLQDN